jgi:hypothetical protein
MKSLKPNWLRKTGSNVVLLVPCGGRKEVVEKLPSELERCLDAGGHTTLMVWADCDDNCADPEALKTHFWKDAQRQAITKEQFERVVFIFAKDRIENWIEFLRTGTTDESKEGPRVSNPEATEAAKKLAAMCKENRPVNNMPPSLRWSCNNWRALDKSMWTPWLYSAGTGCPIQIKQMDKVGRSDIDGFEAVMMREDRQRGFFVGFGFSAEADHECANFHKWSGKIITVLEILDEQHVQKM